MYLIRFAIDSDIPSLIEFNQLIARETEGKELDTDTISSGVKRGMHQGDEVRYIVAECDSRPVGCMLLTREWSDWRNGWIIWLQSVYVCKKHRRQGVFRKMLDFVTTFHRKDKDFVGLRLYVKNGNYRAYNAYKEAGFCDPEYQVLENILDR